MGLHEYIVNMYELWLGLAIGGFRLVVITDTVQR